MARKVMMRQFGPGTLGCHEALHMAAVLLEMVDERLCQHPAVESIPAWRNMADSARDTLAALYAAIGAEHLAAPHD